MTIVKREFVSHTAQPGCDCWNPGHVVRETLKQYPDATRIDYAPLTGMWTDVEVTVDRQSRMIRVTR